MPLKKMSIRLLLLFLILGAWSVTSPAFARTQDTGRDPVEAAIRNPANGGNVYVANAGQQINEFLGDVQHFMQKDVLTPVNTLIQSTLGAFQVPDLAQLWGQIMGGSASRDPGAMLSETLENKTRGGSSYGIREDLSKSAATATATGIANQSILSQAAQTRMAQVRQATQQDTQESTRLGEESQGLDVTQRIMQNLSQQSALNSQVSQRVLQEAQQARVDRAIGNMLSAQTTRELSAITTADRRKTISAGNAASQQGGLMMMPGGVTLGADR
jgi:hypothetical protein